MEHSIGVGIIVGLTFASSAYIWNSDNFTKEQKTILLIFVVFPPLQWVATLLVSIYNTNRENNTIEKITEKKIDFTISNLSNLKQKGILTENEYKEKVTKIDQEKTEQYLKSSVEYKQLKSLLDNNILTQEEFDKKIKIIEKKYKNINYVDLRFKSYKINGIKYSLESLTIAVQSGEIKLWRNTKIKLIDGTKKTVENIPELLGLL